MKCREDLTYGARSPLISLRPKAVRFAGLVIPERDDGMLVPLLEALFPRSACVNVRLDSDRAVRFVFVNFVGPFSHCPVLLFFRLLDHIAVNVA